MNEAVSVAAVVERLRAGAISQRPRRRAIAAEVSVVLIGSENAGRIMPVTGVADGSTAAQGYDDLVVQRAVPLTGRDGSKSACLEVG